MFKEGHVIGTQESSSRGLHSRFEWSVVEVISGNAMLMNPVLAAVVGMYYAWKVSGRLK